jgi:hypothetical protein
MTSLKFTTKTVKFIRINLTRDVEDQFTQKKKDNSLLRAVGKC